MRAGVAAWPWILLALGGVPRGAHLIIAPHDTSTCWQLVLVLPLKALYLLYQYDVRCLHSLRTYIPQITRIS